MISDYKIKSKSLIEKYRYKEVSEEICQTQERLSFVKKENGEKDRKEKNKFSRENNKEITLYGEEEERERP